jgi:hypothetical protein
MRRTSIMISWTRAILSRHGPPDSLTRFVALAIGTHMNGDGTSCFPSIKTLAAETQLSHVTVGRRLTDLERGGWLERWQEQGHGQRWRLGHYEATFPADLDVSEFNAPWVDDYTTFKRGEGTKRRYSARSVRKSTGRSEADKPGVPASGKKATVKADTSALHGVTPLRHATDVVKAGQKAEKTQDEGKKRQSEAEKLQGGKVSNGVSTKLTDEIFREIDSLNIQLEGLPAGAGNPRAQQILNANGAKANQIVANPELHNDRAMEKAEKLVNVLPDISAALLANQSGLTEQAALAFLRQRR